MAHIVFLTYGITSYLNASYAIAAGLRARGHRVTYVSSLDVETAVTAQGFEFALLAEEARIRQDPERLALERLPGWQRYRQRAALVRVGKRQRAFYLERDEWPRMLMQLQPDAVLIDEELPEAIIRTASLGVPMLLVQYIGGTRWRAGLPPASSDVLPEKRIGSQLEIAAAWLMLWTKRVLTHRLAPLFYGGTDRRSIIRAVAAQAGFDMRRAAFHHWFPMTFRDLHTIVLAAPEFDFAEVTVPGETYVGPLVWPERTDPIDPAAAADVRSFLARSAACRRPLVYCSLGTFWQMNLAFLQRVVAAFRQRPEWDLVLASGRGTAVDAFAPVPDNVLVCERVPQLDVLQRADVVLTHGGIGTINECITYGVPMIVYSTGKMEQNGSAARVVFHGMGLRGEIDAATPERIAAQVEHVLSMRAFRKRVAAMQAVYARYQAENQAVALIESLLRTD